MQSLLALKHLTLDHYQDGGTPNSSVEDRVSASGGMYTGFVEDFDPAQEFSNHFDGYSDSDDGESVYDITVLGSLGL